MKDTAFHRGAALCISVYCYVSNYLELSIFKEKTNYLTKVQRVRNLGVAQLAKKCPPSPENNEKHLYF